MKRLILSKVRDLNFGRHIGRSFDNLDSPLVVIYGPNESGKSTLAEFLTWAVGGPWRTAAKNSEIFRIKSGDDVYGNVSATLEDDVLELEARFRVKEKGLPNDKRKGVLAGREHDAEGLRISLGGITADDYQLIYRLYGGSLGDIGSGEEFSNLFSSFAMGSTSAALNPRLALERVETRCKALETSIKEEKKKLKEIDGQIKSAQRAPEEIAVLEVQIKELSDSIDGRAAHTQQLVAERDLITRLISGLSHLKEKERAEGEIRSLAAVSKEMQTVAENLSDVRQLMEHKRLAETAAHDSRQAADRAILECGLPESSIKERTFSPLERVEVAGAARQLFEVAERRASAAAAAVDIEGTHREKQAEIERQCTQLGLREGQLAQLDAISADLPSLSERAGRWVEQVNAAIEDEAKLSAFQNVPDSGLGTDIQRGLPPAGLAAGFVLVALAGFANPIVGFALAAAFAALALFFRTRNRSAKLGMTEGSSSGQLAPNILRDLEEHRNQAASHRARLIEGLGPLADLISDADTARTRIASLTQLAVWRRQLTELSVDLSAAQYEVAQATSALTAAEENAKKVLGARDIPLELVGHDFERWLARYESAVLALAANASAQRHLDELLQKLSALLAPIRGEVGGLELNAIVERVSEAHAVEEQRKAAFLRVQAADLSITAAKLDSSAARDLLRSFDDESKLRGRFEVVSSEAATATSERDREIAKRAELDAELRERSGVEKLPGLNLARGQCEETIEEVSYEFEAAKVALRVLRETIDRYERENQDPVVAAASALINKVVPDWGTVVFSRDDKQYPVLERADNNGRLNEKVLSDGARALLYLGIRLAFAQKDADKRGVALPLICDDPLIHFDDDRSLSALRLLAEFSKNHQVVLFTCETSTRDKASGLGAAVLEM